MKREDVVRPVMGIQEEPDEQAVREPSPRRPIRSARHIGQNRHTPKTNFTGSPPKRTANRLRR